jgi:hypothetical protein
MEHRDGLAAARYDDVGLDSGVIRPTHVAHRAEAEVVSRDRRCLADAEREVLLDLVRLHAGDPERCEADAEVRDHHADDGRRQGLALHAAWLPDE